MVYRRPLVWTSVVAAATALPISIPPAIAFDTGIDAKTLAAEAWNSATTSPAMLIAATGQGGEGGEAGLVVEDLGTDPVAYLTALDIIRGHELAGRDLYAAGDAAGALVLFEHAISETYDKIAPVLPKLGVSDIRAALAATVGKAKAGVTPAELAKAVEEAVAALDAVGAGKPKSAQSDAAVDAAVVTSMLKRVVHNFELVAAKPDGEAYIDGYGYLVAAKARSERLRPILSKTNQAGLGLLDVALAALSEVFPGAKMPEQIAAKPGPILGKVSKALFMLSDLH